MSSNPLHKLTTGHDYGTGQHTLGVDMGGNLRSSLSDVSAASGKSSLHSNVRRQSRLSRASNASGVSGSGVRRSWAGEYVPRPSLMAPNAAISEAHEKDSPLDILKREYHLIFGFACAIFFFIWAGDHHTLEDLDPPLFALVFMLIFVIILWHAFCVVRHADCLAVKLGEPFGTLILTLSVISIEVIMMAALLITGDEPTLARDTMFSVVMIVLNGMVGVTLILGGIRYEEQAFNLQSSQTFLNVILPLSVMGLVIPRFTQGGQTDSFGVIIPGTISTLHAVFLILVNVFLYGTFLVVQTMFHPDFFMHDSTEESIKTAGDGEALAREAVDMQKDAVQMEEMHQNRVGEPETVEEVTRELKVLRQHQTKLSKSVYSLAKQVHPDAVSRIENEGQEPVFEGEEHEDEHAGLVIRSVKYHAVLLVLSMTPISLLAEKLAILVEKLVTDVGAPNAFAGFVVAVLVLSPEAMGAARAALGNKIQRTINIALGSALSTIGLTIPSVVTISLLLDKTLVLGLPVVGCVELGLTLFVTLTTFLGGRTNLLQGFVHCILFVSYIVLLFEENGAEDTPAPPTLAPLTPLATPSD